MPRQQSLAATIDWSYRLLSEPEQTMFARLSVFAGGFDLDAAHGVCGEDGTTEDDTLDLLTGLVDKSMVIVRGGADWTRYGVLETLRAYGRERLQDEPALSIASECDMRPITPSLRSRLPPVCTEPTSGRGCCGCCPTTTT